MDESTEKQTKVESWEIEHRMNQSTVTTSLSLRRYEGYMSIIGHISGKLICAGLINAQARRQLLDAAVIVLEHRVEDPDCPTMNRSIIEEVQLQRGTSLKFVKLQDGMVRFILINQSRTYFNVCVETNQSELGQFMSALHHHQWFPLNGQRIPDS